MKKSGQAEQTKYRLADSLKECMKTSPLEDITVKEIVSGCGMTRQTFYRHFLDRNDLVNWYFDKVLHESFRQMGSGETIYDGLIRKFIYIRQEYVFFRAAFSSEDQNNLKEHDFAMIFDFYQDKIRQKTGYPPEAEILELLEMYCRASVYRTVKWVLQDMPQSEKELAGIMVEAMPPKLAALFAKLGLLG